MVLLSNTLSKVFLEFFIITWESMLVIRESFISVGKEKKKETQLLSHFAEGHKDFTEHFYVRSNFGINFATIILWLCITVFVTTHPCLNFRLL